MAQKELFEYFKASNAYSSTVKRESRPPARASRRRRRVERTKAADRPKSRAAKSSRGRALDDVDGAGSGRALPILLGAAVVLVGASILLVGHVMKKGWASGAKGAPSLESRSELPRFSLLLEEMELNDENRMRAMERVNHLQKLGFLDTEAYASKKMIRIYAGSATSETDPGLVAMKEQLAAKIMLQARVVRRPPAAPGPSQQP